MHPSFGPILASSLGVQRWPDASHINLHEEAIMYARLTTFRVKPDRLEDMRRWREENQAEILAQPGLRQWIGLTSDDGEVTVVAIFDDEQTARETMQYVRGLWSQMAPMIEGEPTARFLEVLAAENLAAQGQAAT
jgi:hypothetical protein